MGHVAYEYTQRLRLRGENVHIFTLQLSQSIEDPDYVHRLPPIIHVGNAGVLSSLYKRLSGFDIVHLHYPFFGGAEPVIVRKALRHDQGLCSPIIWITSHGLRGAIFEAHRRLLFPWLISRADRILVSSEDYLKHCSLQDVPRVLDRVEIHPFGVDLDRFHPGKDEPLRHELNIPVLDPIVIFVGGLDAAHHFKGLSILLEALSKLSHFPWTCVVVGSGALKATYEAQAQQYGIASRVRFVGDLSEEDLPRYYRLANFHVLPSTRRAEAFGMVTLESAASGIPSIVSDLPGMRSVTLHGETGIIVPPENTDELVLALSLFFERPDLCARFGFSARKRAEIAHAWEPLINRLMSTYDSVYQQQSARIYPV